MSANLLFLKIGIKFSMNNLVDKSHILKDGHQVFFINGLGNESPIFKNKFFFFNEWTSQ